MRKIFDDLWQTRTFSPFPGLTTHAYLWTADRNVLFYSVGDDTDFDEIEALGGISDQYLSHRDEAGPMLAKISERFGASLHAPAPELLEIGEHAHVDVPLGSRHVDANGVEVFPTPGHTPGSTCYLVTGAHGATYLFTGDTMFRGHSGDWAAGFIAGMSDAAALAQTLDLLATLDPDIVISSAFAGDNGVHDLRGQSWPDCVAQAAATLVATRA